MRLQNILPGLQPSQAEQPLKTSAGEPFQKRLQRVSEVIPASWKRLLRVELPPDSQALLSPPPQPGTLVLQDAVMDRLSWRSLLDQKSRVLDSLSTEQKATSEMHSVAQMLALLLSHQLMEDELISRYVSESGG